MRGCHDLNGRKNLNEKSGSRQPEELDSDWCQSLLCLQNIPKQPREGRILAVLLDLGLIQKARVDYEHNSNVKSDGADADGGIKFAGWEPKVGFLLVLLDYRIVSRKLICREF